MNDQLTTGEQVAVIGVATAAAGVNGLLTGLRFGAVVGAVAAGLRGGRRTSKRARR